MVYYVEESTGPASPTFSPSGGQVAYGTQVTLTQNEADMIMYTTDGSAPSYANENGEVYTTPIAITADMTIRAIAIDADENESEVATAVYTLIRPAAPTFSPNGGQVAYGTTVTVSAPTGCTILYTTDGTDPYESGSAVDVNSNTASVTITESITLKAIALDANLIPSTVAEATFTVAEIGAVKYVLVTDASTLQDGDEVIIVGKKGNSSAAMSTTQNNNNRPEIDVTSAVQRDGSIIAPPTVATITLGATTVGNNTAAWTLYVNNGASTGYLYAASSSSNQLKTKDEVDNNARATISIDESNGEATVQFKGTYTRNQLKYNSTSQLFSCYASGQQPISIYRKTVIPSPKVEVSSLGYGTMYYGDRNLIVPEGVRAHALTTNGNQLVITKTYAANDVIPAGTAVMLVETTQPYSKQQLRFVSTHTTGTAPADNYLQGTDEEEIIDDAGYKYYMLTTKSGVLGFYWQQGSNEGTAIMNAAHKAYLRVPTGAGIKGFTFDNLVTGITAINGNGNTNGNDGWYTLDGRRLSGPPTQQGIYIHNGRKEVVK